MEATVGSRALGAWAARRQFLLAPISLRALVLLVVWLCTSFDYCLPKRRHMMTRTFSFSYARAVCRVLLSSSPFCICLVPSDSVLGEESALVNATS
jgi:hypothetical protein